MDKLEQVPYSGNRLSKTLALGQKIADQWGTNLLILKMGRKIKADSGASTKLAEAAAVRHWIHNRVRYVSDPINAEMVGDPLWTLEHGGDCDDMATLACAILQGLGHKATIAAVQWKGRKDPTHAVCLDWTAGAVVDPVPENDVEMWPPAGYEVDHMLYQNPGGEIVALDGLFGNLFKSINKVVAKIIPPKTFVGKLLDPLGLGTRNQKWGVKIADIVGTAATLVGGAYAVGAASGAGGGFWSTVGAGASTVGTGIKTAAGAVGGALTSKTGMAIALPLLAATLKPGATGAGQMMPEGLPPGAYMNPDGTISYGGGGYGGGGGGDFGGGGGQVVGYDQQGRPIYGPASTGIPTWALLAGGALLVVGFTMSKRR